MGSKFAIRRNPVALSAARKGRYKELNDFFWKHVGQERYAVESQRAWAKVVQYHYAVDIKKREKQKNVNVRLIVAQAFSGIQEILERPMFASLTERFRQ